MTNRQLGKLTGSKLRKEVQKLVNTANKRISRLEKTPLGEFSPALKYLQEKKHITRFSIKGLKDQQIRNVYKGINQFLKAQTSTVTGWKKVRRETYKRVAGTDRPFIDEEDEKGYWRAYRRLEGHNETDIFSKSRFSSEETQRELYRRVVNNPSNSIDYSIENRFEAFVTKLEDEERGIYEKTREYEKSSNLEYSSSELDEYFNELFE